MAYTSADLSRLDDAIASGELDVWVGNRRVRYRTIDELMRARQHVAQQLESDGTASKRSFQFQFTTGRGD